MYNNQIWEVQYPDVPRAEYFWLPARVSEPAHRSWHHPRALVTYNIHEFVMSHECCQTQTDVIASYSGKVAIKQMTYFAQVRTVGDMKYS